MGTKRQLLSWLEDTRTLKQNTSAYVRILRKIEYVYATYRRALVVIVAGLVQDIVATLIFTWSPTKPASVVAVNT